MKQETKETPLERRVRTGHIQRRDIQRRLAELAFGRANDCVRLVLEEGPDVDALDLSLLSEVKRNDKGYITEFEGTHKKFGEDYDGHFRIANSFDDHGNLTTSEYIGWEWSTTTNYKYDTQDVYAEIEQQFVDYEEITKETATVKVIETDAHGNWTKAYLFCKNTLETESLESDEKVISKGDDTYYILTRKITYWE